VTPVSDAVLPAVPAHSPASAEGAKLKPADVAVTDAAGALVAPPAAPGVAALPLMPLAPPEAVGPPLPSAAAGAQGAVVVVLVVAVDLDFAAAAAVVEVVDEPPLGGVVVGVVVLDVVVQGTVAAVPRAWAVWFTSVPPPAAPRYGLTRAPHEVATRDNTRTPSRPADLLLTSAPRAQACIYITQAWPRLLRTPRPMVRFLPSQTTYTRRTAGTLSVA
jgi:hypothetical protein